VSAKRAQGRGRKAETGRRIGLFGGTFDPIHLGHLAVARAAEQRFRLNQVIFIPVGHPPHKPATDLPPYEHRFGMVALACAGHPRFVTSLAESGYDGAEPRVCYSVDTVRLFREQFKEPGDRLYFILGADSFLDLPDWKDYDTLLDLCDFIVASRPGFRTDALRQVIPSRLLPTEPSASADSLAIPLLQTTVHLLDSVKSRVSATEVRRRLEQGRSIRGLVPPRVEEYIIKQALYR
jgi:nicotinate-nucleotide adenylyltransferase